MGMSGDFENAIREGDLKSAHRHGHLRREGFCSKK